MTRAGERSDAGITVGALDVACGPWEGGSKRERERGGRGKRAVDGLKKVTTTKEEEEEELLSS